MAVRIAKLNQLAHLGMEGYPPRAVRSHSAGEVVALVEATSDAAGLGALSAVDVVGRVVGRRDMGKATFIDLLDGSGRIQVLLRQNELPTELYEGLKLVDLGDFIGVHGSPIRTRTGQPTVAAASWTMLTKTLHAPPEKFHGLADAEQRQRRRYLDLMANEETRRTFTIRSKAIAAVRRFLDDRGFLEVETPILQESESGAAARPFVTRFNAIEEDRVLRVSLELHLKRLVIGGFDRVFEIGRNFRNEGMSFKHNPEFTMIETYQAYADYNDVARMVEEMVSTVALQVLGTTRITFRDHEIELAPPWRRVTFFDAMRGFGGPDLDVFCDTESLRAELRRRGVEAPETAGYGKLADEAMSHYIEPNLIQPTFLMDYPVELSPLAKGKPGNPRLVERFECFMAGFEFGNAYTELNDPIEQRARLDAQHALRQAGDDEVEMVDEDFLFALEHGMPPTGGFGMGIDRLVMLLTGQTSIREVILFPPMKSLKE
jgi:lysyl-tRNA synthetase class 2